MNRGSTILYTVVAVLLVGAGVIWAVIWLINTITEIGRTTAQALHGTTLRFFAKLSATRVIADDQATIAVACEHLLDHARSDDPISAWTSSRVEITKSATPCFDIA